MPLSYSQLQTYRRCPQQYEFAVVKKLGRQIKGYDDKMWECIRQGYMTYVCYLKFSQNAELKRELLETGNRILVEASPLDKIWGVGLNEQDAAAGIPWRGLNLLGETLMKVREMVR
jgi:ribA/ribD-fused uncharacterized protein